MPYTPPEFEDHSLSKEVTAAKLTTMAQAIGSATGLQNIASKPTPGGHGSVVPGTPGLSRIVNIAFVGETSQTEFTLSHNLENFLPGCTIYKEIGAGEFEQTIVKYHAVNANTLVVVFSVAPAAGVVFFAQVDG